MGLIELAGGLLRGIVTTVTRGMETSPPSFWRAEDMAYDVADDIWGGADDLWPGEGIAATRSEPELLLTAQFGLRLPNDTIVWNAWNNPPLVIPFDNPLDRLRMVANLQKTATDLGFEIEDFLTHYGWVTRNQIATVVYEDTGAYSLTDPAICRIVGPATTPDIDNDDSSEEGADG